MADISPIRIDQQGRTAVAVERHYLYGPEQEWTYAHHPHLAFWGGRYWAMWSNGRANEDDVGQRVLLSTSADFGTWSAPTPLIDSQQGKHSQVVFTAAGFFAVREERLVAYAGRYEYRDRALVEGQRAPYDKGHQDTVLCAVVTEDGASWGALQELPLPIVPNYGPQATASGRWIISGNVMFPYSDGTDGLGGWVPTGIYPAAMAAEVFDDSEGFWRVRERAGWPHGLCEGSFYQTDDGVLHMLLRSGTQHLWVTQSDDDGTTWSAPRPTGFTDNVTKFHFGRLGDGRFYYVGCPDPEPRYARSPLVLALSEDGVVFDHCRVLADDGTPYRQQREGLHKGGDYGYPHTLVHDGHLCVIVSRKKEGVEVLRVGLAEVDAAGPGVRGRAGRD